MVSSTPPVEPPSPPPPPIDWPCMALAILPSVEIEPELPMVTLPPALATLPEPPIASRPPLSPPEPPPPPIDWAKIPCAKSPVVRMPETILPV